jgi:uncharacterized membrane protein YphA (DoxX/SURF4 family)
MAEGAPRQHPPESDEASASIANRKSQIKNGNNHHAPDRNRPDAARRSGTAAMRPVIDGLSLLARWLLGGLFVSMGLSKALHPVEFLKLLRQYQLVNDPFLLNSIAASLPWFEIFCGLLLVAGIAVRGSALVSLSMLVPFTVVVIKRALAISAAQGLAFCAVKFDCGCGTGEVFICHKIFENTSLILLSAWLLAGYGRRLALRFSLFGGKCD